MQLFAHLQDKDVFSDMYRRDLAKRLLGEHSISHESEKAMIAKLKMQCGAPYTAKMEGTCETCRPFAHFSGGAKCSQQCPALVLAFFALTLQWGCMCCTGMLRDFMLCSEVNDEYHESASASSGAVAGAAGAGGGWIFRCRC